MGGCCACWGARGLTLRGGVGSGMRTLWGHSSGSKEATVGMVPCRPGGSGAAVMAAGGGIVARCLQKIGMEIRQTPCHMLGHCAAVP